MFWEECLQLSVNILKYENMIGEALKKSGYDLYYYKREDSTLKENFFVRTASELILIEVKATNNKTK